jgi:hypothetical protein
MSHAIKSDLYAIANGPLAIDLVDGFARTLPAPAGVLIDLIIGVDSSLTHTTEAHNPAHNPLSILSRLTHLLKNSLSSLT